MFERLRLIPERLGILRKNITPPTARELNEAELKALNDLTSFQIANIRTPLDFNIHYFTIERLIKEYRTAFNRKISQTSFIATKS